jgi:hypothetical protein
VERAAGRARRDAPERDVSTPHAFIDGVVHRGSHDAAAPLEALKAGEDR